jgi:hypothetical protein
MKQFKDFKIKESSTGFTGTKVQMSRILNVQIEIVDYRIENSKYPDKFEKCLWMQISIDKIKHVVFSGSKFLIGAIEQIPRSEFPFLATIIRENDRFQFT